MTTKQFNRLVKFNNQAIKQSSHKPSLLGRRNAKGRAKGVGQWLAKSKVREQVPLEKVFISRP